MSTDGQSRDPRSHLSAAIRAATSDDLDLALAGILDAALAGSGAAARTLFADPDRAEPQLAASVGMDEGEAQALTATPDAGVSSTLW